MSLFSHFVIALTQISRKFTTNHTTVLLHCFMCSTFKEYFELCDKGTAKDQIAALIRNDMNARVENFCLLFYYQQHGTWIHGTILFFGLYLDFFLYLWYQVRFFFISRILTSGNYTLICLAPNFLTFR